MRAGIKNSWKYEKDLITIFKLNINDFAISQACNSTVIQLY